VSHVARERAVVDLVLQFETGTVQSETMFYILPVAGTENSTQRSSRIRIYQLAY